MTYSLSVCFRKTFQSSQFLRDDCCFNNLFFSPHKKIFVVVVLLIWPLYTFSLEKQDTIVSRSSLYVFPQLSYQPETSFAPGIAYGYYFKSKDISRISSISGSTVYTFKNQFIFNVTPKIFFGSNKWYVYSNLNIRNYPDYYFGIGNTLNSIRQTFTAQNISVFIMPQCILSKYFFLGISLSARYERIHTDSTFETKRAAIFNQFGSCGWEPYSQMSVGLSLAFDKRDNQFYPQKGIFAKTQFSVSKAGWGSSYSLQRLSMDFREYIPLFNSHVFAFQAIYSGIFGTKGIPFELLPTLGGCDILRGFRQGMYRENVLTMIQSEYRFPVYKRWRAAVFCSSGDVMSSTDYKIDKLKVSYGAGFRYRLNDARVNIRFDFAKTNYSNKTQFYITTSEAF